jgi:hypothetical protein
LGLILEEVLQVKTKFEPGHSYFSARKSASHIATYAIIKRDHMSITLTGGRKFLLRTQPDGVEAFYPLGRSLFSSIVRADYHHDGPPVPQIDDGAWLSMW